MNKHYEIVFLLLVLSNSFLNAQEDQVKSENSICNIANEDASSFYQSGIKEFSFPARFSEKDWLISVVVLSTTGLAFLVDNDVRTFWLHHHRKTLDDLSSVGYLYGGLKNAAILTGAVYITGIVSGSKKMHQAGRHLLEGLFFAGLTTTVIKSLAGRSRPYTNDGPDNFNPVQFNTEHTSFPSGHITTAFTISAVLSNEINNIYADVVLYTLAGTTFFQRMYDDKHWLSDSILAAAIGYFIGNSIGDLDKKSSLQNISLEPTLINEEVGLNLVLHF